ncbi:unnamed protein product, partial [Rotaria magnacalcarata]
MFYAGDDSKIPEIESVLFKTTVNNKTRLSLTSCANMGSLSYYQDESAVLSPIVTIFPIVLITENTN